MALHLGKEGDGVGSREQSAAIEGVPAADGGGLDLMGTVEG